VGNRRKKWPLLLAFLLVLSCLCGCSIEEGDTKKVSDLSFVVVKDEEIPERLRELIQESKTKPFKLTYSDDDYLYMVMGYGEQASSGYSIQVKECYLTSNAIVFKTALLGPSKEEQIVETKTYPYIVVKTEYREEMVVFQ
jgi:hypothetical protein